MKSHWLVKTEPSTYSYADLEREGRTVWDGVTNPLALKHLRSMQVGDEVFIYHTGAEKQIVGIAVVTRAAKPDLGAGNPNLVAVEIQPVQRLARPVTLATIKTRREFAEFALVRMGRLSVMPVTAAQWERIQAFSG